MGYTGRLLETDMFGERFSGQSGRAAEYKEYEDALEEVKKDYPWDPTDPMPRFANNLHAEVAQELGLEDWSELKLYTAVGSALDRYHGVDAFFEYGDGRVTLDVTKNPAKAEGYKPGVMIIGEEEFDYPVRRAETAIKIAEELQERQREAARGSPQKRQEGGLARLAEIHRRRRRWRKAK